MINPLHSLLFLCLLFVWSKQDCGIAHHRSKRIVNGEDTAKNQWSWVVSIFLRVPKNPKRIHYHCTGVLIHKRLVLTAAHCTKRITKTAWLEVKPNDMIVITGDHRVTHVDTGEKQIRVKRIFQHNQWVGQPRKFKNDVAILVLTGENPNTEVICTVAGLQHTIDKSWSCITVGWGHTNHSEKYGVSNVLQQVKVPIWEQNLCQKAWRKRIVIDSSLLCGGVVYYNEREKSKAKGPCVFDSGGPLMCSRDSKIWYVLGVINFGNTPCLRERPPVFANMTYFSNFVANVADKVGMQLPKPKNHCTCTCD